ncbi:hypothetical protein MAR_025384 [Mya arenaria]|uniref:Uncharacterized protein n=1 Tax=Mya arenaria TaxID=6604 RepID=A0ABY7DTG7_MYAAR|nr:hypothetical protein MAR_025384 [Mya arenaria]
MSCKLENNRHLVLMFACEEISEQRSVKSSATWLHRAVCASMQVIVTIKRSGERAAVSRATGHT